LKPNPSGRGIAEVVVGLPMKSLGGASLGDGAGTETLVVVLDKDLSTTGSGDAFVAVLELPQ